MLSILTSLSLLLGATQDPGLRPGDVALLEAEEPARREPDDGRFGRPNPARWASGRACLVAFSGSGRCAWSFDLEQGGPHRIWLRYAARTAPDLPAGIDPPPGAELEVRELPATGGYEGKHAWGWGLVFEGELAAGAHELVLGAAPLRPDCLLVTREDGAPDLLAPPPPPSYDAETLARLSRPLVPVGASTGAAPRPLPEWYEATRVTAHTRLARGWVERPLFEQAAEALAGLGAPAYVRHVKPMGGGTWWPSAVGAVESVARERDLVAGMAERAREHGLRLITYYRHVEDRAAVTEHPDWACVDDLGQGIGRKGEPRPCLSSPYLDFLAARLVELAQRGVDGIYLDEDHQPLEGCWCAWCREAFTRATGLPHPERMDDEDPLYRKLREFTDVTIERAIARLQREVHAARPGTVVLVSSHLQPDLMEPHPSTRLLGIADAVKTEYGVGADARSRAFFARHPGLDEPPRDLRLALGWALSRDGSNGRPPHVWIHGLSDPLAARSATAAVIAYGGVANLDMPEESIPDPGTFGPALELGARLGGVYATTRPARLVALHFPERARAALEPDEAAVWRELLAPLAGAWSAHVRERIPAVLVTDDQLATPGALDGCAALFLPAPATLEPAVAAQVEAFADAGGLVLAPDDEDRWHEPGEASVAAQERYLAALAPALEGWPVRVEAPGRVHATFFRGHDPERLVVGLVNDFAWVWSERREDAGGRPLRLPEGVDVPPAPVEGARIELRMARPPDSVLDAITGERLPVTREEGRTFVDVPAFDVARVLVIEL